MSRTISITILAALALAGCKTLNVGTSINRNTAQPAANTSMPPKPDGETMPKPSGEVMAKPGVASSYVPFTQAAYDAARASGQPTILYFYATWCPICARQEPIIVDLFGGSEISDWGIAAFRVNFNDPQTDADERAIAEQLGISYQHTFVLLDASGKVVAKVNGQQTKEQLKQALEKIK